MNTQPSNTHKRVLVTGGAGFIGSNFIRYALNAHPDWQIINFDKLTYAGNLANLQDVEDHPRYRFVRGDIGDETLVDYLFQTERFDVVINFAAESHVDRSILDATPFIQTNIQGVQVLLQCAQRLWMEGRDLKPEFKAARFIQISTDEVFGTIDEGYFTEESPIQPNSPYAASKASGDLLCRAFHETYRFPIIVTRACNNYGPYQFPEKLIPLMIYRAQNNESLPVYGDGSNVREWIHVEDHCRGILAVLENGKSGKAYNIGSGEETQNLQIVEMILEKLAKPTSLIEFVKDRLGHDSRYALDFSKTESLGFAPKYQLAERLSDTIHWYLNHGAWVDQVTSGEYQSYYQLQYAH